MLKEALLSPKKVVSINDTALQGVLTPSELMRYALSRDYSIIESVQFVTKPTVFTIDPLIAEHEVLVDYPMMLFGLYVKDVENVPEPMKQFEFKNGRRMLTEDACKRYPRDVKREIGDIIVQLASKDGDLLPFTLPPGWRDLTTERNRLAALNANTTNANQTNSHSQTE